MSAAATDAAERMDRIYRTQRHVYDLTRRPYLLGRTALVRSLRPPPDGHVLEIACGTAWNLVRAAQHYPDAHLYGLDVSSAMLAIARRSIARHGLERRIHVADADATSFDPLSLFGRRHFDRIFISYALSMIPDWTGALARASEALAKGGSLHIVDFGQCERLPEVFRRVLLAWLARFSVAPRADLQLAIEHLARTGGFASKAARPYRGYATRAILTRLA